MREQTLRDFFIGAADAAELRRDLEGSVVRTSADVTHQRIIDMPDEFEVHSEHLIRLCDVVLAGELPPPELESIGFCLVASDHFVWNGDTPDGARVAEAAYDWSAPTINFALTPTTVAKLRRRLLTGEDTFTREDHTSSHVRRAQRTAVRDVRPGW